MLDLQTFKAATPSLQEWCVAVINGSRKSSAQFGQDVFAWRNAFANRGPAAGRGFYVESGANRPRFGSNTFFFDKCLGWDGLCIEANPKYLAQLRNERSCTVVGECISAVPNSTLRFAPASVFGHVDPEHGTLEVRCNPLDIMLGRLGRAHVDFWSLDVEGHEMAVLQGTRWDKIAVDFLLIEDYWLDTRELDYFMGKSGFLKMQQMPMDSLWASRRHEVTQLLPERLEYPFGYDQEWASTKKMRQKPKFTSMYNKMHNINPKAGPNCVPHNKSA